MGRVIIAFWTVNSTFDQDSSGLIYSGPLELTEWELLKYRLGHHHFDFLQRGGNLSKLSGIFAAGFHFVRCNARTTWRYSTSNLARFSVWRWGRRIRFITFASKSEKAPRNELDNRITNPWNFYAFVQIRAAWHQRKLTRRRRSSY